MMTLIERIEPLKPHKDDPPCTCGQMAAIDKDRHDWRCARRLWIERNLARVRELEAAEAVGEACDTNMPRDGSTVDMATIAAACERLWERVVGPSARER